MNIVNQRHASSEALAKKLRLDILEMIHHGHSSHIGAVLSMLDFLAVLYYDILHYRPGEPDWAERDRVILSKGHAGAGIYAVLAECGFFPVEQLMTHCGDGSLLSGHVSHVGLPGVEISTGSLGHGLAVGCGMAYALKMAGNAARVYVILGDGECAEGAVWEAAAFAAHHRLNVTAIVDRNRMQGMGRGEEILNLEPFAAKWNAFGWSVAEVDGHHHADLRSALRAGGASPFCLIADTVKGKGVSFMEGQLCWHYQSPQDEDYRQARRELEKER